MQAEGLFCYCRWHKAAGDAAKQAAKLQAQAKAATAQTDTATAAAAEAQKLAMSLHIATAPLRRESPPSGLQVS